MKLLDDKKRSGIITLTTDFGTTDGYLGAMKGVILNINPKAQLVDITHDIPPQGIAEAAFVLKNSAYFFPKGTVHLAVVDPGVGSKRKLIILEERGHFFLAPDNGVLGLVARAPSVAITILPKIFPAEEISSTFHGRDILAPVAAHISLGKRPEEYGNRLRAFKRISLPRPYKTDRRISGKILYIDHFGNLITNINKDHLARYRIRSIELAGKSVKGIKSSYFEGRKGEIMALIGSHNFLELAIRNGNTCQILGVKRGDRVTLTFAQSR